MIYTARVMLTRLLMALAEVAAPGDVKAELGRLRAGRG